LLCPLNDIVAHNLRLKTQESYFVTVVSHLTERFVVERIRVADLWHFQHRLIHEVLVHTLACFLTSKSFVCRAI
jgi:hypothetical protein